MKKITNFEWTLEYKQVLQGFKECLSRPPILCKLEEGKPLFLYFSVNEGAIGSGLVKEEDIEQKLVYFMNKTLYRPELQYEKLKKAAFFPTHISWTIEIVFPGAHHHSENRPVDLASHAQTGSRWTDGGMVH